MTKKKLEMVLDAIDLKKRMSGGTAYDFIVQDEASQISDEDMNFILHQIRIRT